MIPSIDDRLDSVMRALREVILPALGPEQSLAIEQAHLSLAQLGLIRGHLDQAPAFELEEAQAMLGLAESLLAAADGGAATTAAVMKLRAAVAVSTLDRPAAVRRATCDVGNAIEALIEASGQDGGPAFRAVSFHKVLAAGRVAGLTDRRWNRSVGFEAPDASLD